LIDFSYYAVLLVGCNTGLARPLVRLSVRCWRLMVNFKIHVLMLDFCWKFCWTLLQYVIMELDICWTFVGSCKHPILENKKT